MYSFILKLTRRRRLERDLEAELAFHQEMSGATAATPFGNVTAIKEQARDLWRFTTLENLWRDVVYGIRGLKRNPSLVATALVSLALGIGANSAIFSLGVEFLLSEPSVTDSGSLVCVRFDDSTYMERRTFETVRDSGVFQAVAGEHHEGFVNWNNGHATRPIFNSLTTKNYFTAMGVPMAYGRGYSVNDPDAVAVLHHRFWTQHFHADPKVVGKQITLDGRPYTVVGILPSNHRTLSGFGFAPDVYLPVFQENEDLAMYARLKPGMSRTQAAAAMETLARRLDETRPARKAGDHTASSVDAIAGMAGLSSQRTMPIGLFFLMLLTLAGLVLLIACANVASLLLARASTTRREIQVRLSLGASRGRLIQQLLVESLLLSLTGALLGLGLAQLLNSLLVRMNVPTPIPIRLTAGLDWRVGLYAALLSVVAMLACGLLPAWQSAREALTADARSTGKMFLRRAILVGQVAVSVVVLATGFLFVRNLMRSAGIDPGFDIRRTVRAQVNLPPANFKDPKRIVAYAEQAVAALKALPGVEDSAAARIVPFTDAIRFGATLRFTGGEQAARVQFYWNAITPGYFSSLSIPLLAGRTFVAADAVAAERAVVVSSGFVRKALRQPPAGVVGQTFRWNDRGALYRIVGVAANTKNMTIGEDEQPQVYEYLATADAAQTRLQFVVKSALPPGEQVKAVEEALRRIDADAGIEAQTLFAGIGSAFLPSQIGAAVLGSMGVLGLSLATIGLYGVMTYTVARRTPEIGVRMAIGASRASIVKLILSDAGRLVGYGSALGIAVALVVTRPLAAFLVVGLPPHDPVTFVAVAVVFGVTAGLAAWGPARRAVGVDPMACLRHD